MRYGAGEKPSDWIELNKGVTRPTDSSLFNFNVAGNSGIVDGIYTVSFYAKDKAGLEGEQRVKITLDNTPPTTRIVTPTEGGYLKDAFEVTGDAFDLNLDYYRVELSAGECATADQWASFKTASTPVSNALLAKVPVLPSDSDYCLRLTALDKLGNSTDNKVNIKWDTTPPAAPVLAGQLTKKNISLRWSQNIEPDLAGYNLYRNNQKINQSLLKQGLYADSNLAEGAYAYVVKAVDLAGWESAASNKIALTVDTTAPQTRILSPKESSKVSNDVDIKGTGFSTNDFKQYRVFVGKGLTPSTWDLLHASPVPIQSGLLFQWDTLGFTEGPYRIRLEAEDINGNIGTAEVAVAVDNTPPLAPVLITAAPSGDTAHLSWRANSESDLSGYLIFRNDQLVNFSGIAIGSLKKYLVTGTEFLDKKVPDGRIQYTLVAMDDAGNTSDESNVLELEMDNHPPSAIITEPKDGIVFDTPFTLRAESADLDVASMQYQYKGVNQTAWQNIGNPLLSNPYTMGFDPKSTLATYGDYHLRAVATDQKGNRDPNPSVVLVHYKDITPPAAPTGFTAITDESDVTLTWQANREADLLGYNLYLIWSNGATSKVNQSILQGASFKDQKVPDGKYRYKVTAVDKNNNESTPSSEVVVVVSNKIPSPPTGLTLVVEGYNVSLKWNVNPESDIKGYRLYRNGEKWIPDRADTSYLDQSLRDGVYSYTVTAVDIYGLTSAPSEQKIASVGDNTAPSAPLNFQAVATDQNILLNWSPNAEPDLAGYFLYRKNTAGWTKINNGSLISNTTYTEANRPNGTYTFRLTAVDKIGNESTPSDEAGVQVNVPDTVAPNKPSLFYPTSSLYSVTLHQEKTGLSGFAEPGSTVHLFQQGVAVGTTLALKENTVRTLSLEAGAYSPTLSPDGKYLAYELGESVWLKETASGKKRKIISQGYSPLWSPDGTAIVYLDDQGIKLFDIFTETIVSLGSEGEETFSPSWFYDSQSLMFVSEKSDVQRLWIYDRVSQTTIEVKTSGDFPSDPKPSPDGKKIAYLDRGNTLTLYVVDIMTGESAEVDNAIASYFFDWSPDGKSIAYISNPNNHQDIFIYNIETKQKHQITDTVEYEQSVVWSLEGERLLFLKYDSSWVLSLWELSPFAGDVPLSNEPSQLVQDHLPWGELMATPSLGAHYTTGDGTDILLLKGYFSFTDIALYPGINRFSAVAIDSSNNISPFSDEISVVLDKNTPSDLRLSSDDIIIFPAFPLAGEKVSIGANIWNKGIAPVKDVAVDIYIWNSIGVLEKIRSENIPEIPANTSVFVTALWNPLGKIGTQTVLVVIDPENKVVELLKSNNTVAKEFFIAKIAGPSMTTTLNAAKYKGGEDVLIHLLVRNSGPKINGSVEIWMEDDQGNPITLLQTMDANIPGASEKRFSFIWNTGDTYAGAYRIHSVLKKLGVTLSESTVPFTILPDIRIESSIETEKTAYEANEDVTITTKVLNQGKNYIVPALTLKIRILDPQKNVVLDEEKEITTLLPGLKTQVGSVLNANTRSPGIYTASVDIFLNGELLFNRFISFEIKPILYLTGHLQVTPAVVAQGQNRDIDPPKVLVVAPVADSVVGSIVYLEAAVYDNASGIVSVEYRIDDTTWKTLPITDAAKGRYASLWTPTSSSDGPHQIYFRAKDTAGNISTPIAVRVVVRKKVPREEITGTVSISPSLIMHGKEGVIAYTVTNKGSHAIPNMEVALRIADAVTGEIKDISKRILLGLQPSTLPGEYTIYSSALSPNPHVVTLEVKIDNTYFPLASTRFTVLPGIEIKKTVTDQKRILVWLNIDCGVDADCVKRDIIETVFRQIASPYRIVTKREAFYKELRNNYYTDYILLGSKEKIEGHYADETKRKGLLG